MQKDISNTAGTWRAHMGRVIRILVPTSSIAMAVVHIRLKTHTAGFGDLFVIGVASMALVAEAVSLLSQPRG